MYRFMHFYSTLFVNLYLVSVDIMVCPSYRGWVKDPKTTLLHYCLRDVSFNFV